MKMSQWVVTLSGEHLTKVRGVSAGVLAVTAFLVSTGSVHAQMQQQGGMGCPMMGRMGRMNHRGGMADMGTIRTLFARSGSIRRTVKILPDGIEAITESSDPETATLLQSHVAAMKERREQNLPIRQGDPLFAALFQNADKIVITITPTARGVSVVETSQDPYTVKLLQSHARTVSDFIKNGMVEMHRLHTVPPRQ